MSEERDGMQRNMFSQKPRKERVQREARGGDESREEAVDGSVIFSAVERASELSHQLCTSLRPLVCPLLHIRLGLQMQTDSLMVMKGMSLLLCL